MSVLKRINLTAFVLHLNMLLIPKVHHTYIWDIREFSDNSWICFKCRPKMSITTSIIQVITLIVKHFLPIQKCKHCYI